MIDNTSVTAHRTISGSSSRGSVNSLSSRPQSFQNRYDQKEFAKQHQMMSSDSKGWSPQVGGGKPPHNRRSPNTCTISPQPPTWSISGSFGFAQYSLPVYVDGNDDANVRYNFGPYVASQNKKNAPTAEKESPSSSQFSRSTTTTNISRPDKNISTATVENESPKIIPTTASARASLKSKPTVVKGRGQVIALPSKDRPTMQLRTNFDVKCLASLDNPSVVDTSDTPTTVQSSYTNDNFSPASVTSGVVLPCVPNLSTTSSIGSPPPPGRAQRAKFATLADASDDKSKECFGLLLFTTSLRKDLTWSLRDYVDSYELDLSNRRPCEEQQFNPFRQTKMAVRGYLYKAAKWHLRRTTRASIRRSVSVLRGASFYYDDHEADDEIYADVLKLNEEESEDHAGMKPRLLITRSRMDGLETNCSPSMKAILSDYGVSLFSPLNGVFDDARGEYESLPVSTPDAHSTEKTEIENDSVEEDHAEEEECHFPFSIVPEPEHVLDESPRILDEATMQYLVDYGLPVVIKMRRWVRAYSLIRDGDSFGMMLRMVSQHKYSLLVVKSTKGDVFGGFADCPWQKPESVAGRSFYGMGQAFLFKVNKTEGTGNEKERVTIFRWTGDNSYCQLCDEEGEKIAMGGGGEEGSFGLCLEDYFTRGSTGRCATFGNEPLGSEREFEILDFEVYGFWS